MGYIAYYTYKGERLAIVNRNKNKHDKKYVLMKAVPLIIEKFGDFDIKELKFETGYKAK